MSLGGDARPGRAAQDVLLDGVELRVAVAGDQGALPEALVEIEYRLVADRAVAQVPLAGSIFRDSEPYAVSASVGGTPVTIRLRRSGPLRMAGTITLPGVRTSDTVRIALSYRVRATGEAERYELAIGLPVPVSTAAGAPDGFFTGTLRLPANHRILESFPVVHDRVVDDGGAIWNLSLQAVPAVVQWRARIGEASLLTFTRLIDLAALLVLAVTALVTVRVMRGGTGTG